MGGERRALSADDLDLQLGAFLVEDGDSGGEGSPGWDRVRMRRGEHLFPGQGGDLSREGEEEDSLEYQGTGTGTDTSDDLGGGGQRTELATGALALARALSSGGRGQDEDLDLSLGGSTRHSRLQALPD